MLSAILLIVLGLLAIPSLILSKKPDAKELFDKVAPFQGWFGVIWAIWGLWSIISCFLNLGLLGAGTYGIIIWVIALLVSVVTTALGFILGYGLIQKYALSKNEKAAAAGEQVLAKLLPLQGTMGIIAIVLGILALIGNIIW